MSSSGIKAPAEDENAGDNEDLSQEVARSVPKSAAEQVTCRRITRHHYRCNWWIPKDTGQFDNPAMEGSLVTTSRISRSQFLHAIKVNGNLKVRVVGR